MALCGSGQRTPDDPTRLNAEIVSRTTLVRHPMNRIRFSSTLLVLALVLVSVLDRWHTLGAHTCGSR